MATRILAVEDSPTQAQALKMILESEGYEVVTAVDGSDGLRCLAESEFDLVISDIVMPGLTGYELCRTIKANPGWRDLPIMLLTTLHDPMDIIRALECGADNYITKPYEPDQLLARIARILENKRLRTDGRLKIGIDILFLGKTFTVTSDRQQILDLLITTFEDIVRTNRDLQESQAALADAKTLVEAYARQLEGRVQVSEDKYSTLVEQANDAIFILDGDVKTLEANQAAQRLLSFSSAELIGRPFTDFLSPAQWQEGQLQFQRLLDEGGLRVSDLLLRRKDGRPVYVDYSATLIETNGQRMILAIARDVTERKRIEEEKSRLYHQAQEGIRARDEFLTLASHELRTPLTPLIVQVQSLQRKVERGNPEDLSPELLATRLSRIEHQVERVTNLVNKLLDFSQLDRRWLQLEIEKLDLSALVSEVVDQHRAELETAGCPLALNAATPVEGNWDRVRLEQVVTHLMSNAIRFGAGSPIEVTVDSSGEMARILVRDQGIGMAPEDQVRIFERFERAVPVNHYGGFGLGLWIVRQLVEAMHGTVSVESRPGQGATFTVVLPLVQP